MRARVFQVSPLCTSSPSMLLLPKDTLLSICLVPGPPSLPLFSLCLLTDLPSKPPLFVCLRPPYYPPMSVLSLPTSPPPASTWLKINGKVNTPHRLDILALILLIHGKLALGRHHIWRHGNRWSMLPHPGDVSGLQSKTHSFNKFLQQFLVLWVV